MAGRGFADGRRYFLLPGSRIGPRPDQASWGPWIFDNEDFLERYGHCQWPAVQVGDRVRVVLGDQTRSQGYNNRASIWWVV